MIKGALIPKDNERYRYALWRVWDDELPFMNIIGLNPSTADAVEDDPTIKSCIRIAKYNEYGGIYMTNLFALRSTSPDRLQWDIDPVGKGNDIQIIYYASVCDITVAAWGSKYTDLLGRAKKVISMLNDNGHNLYCFKLNKGGLPSHPLYLPANATRIHLFKKRVKHGR